MEEEESLANMAGVVRVVCGREEFVGVFELVVDYLGEGEECWEQGGGFIYDLISKRQSCMLASGDPRICHPNSEKALLG